MVSRFGKQVSARGVYCSTRKGVSRVEGSIKEGYFGVQGIIREGAYIVRF